MNGKTLRLIRLALKVKQKDFAEQFGIEQTTLSKYERGLLVVPPAKQNRIFKALQHSYNISTTELDDMELLLKKVEQNHEK
ncbi:helix-turn-helix domain-containing protein [Arthrobacter sp. NPDC057013]|uniref:helix-turn-helix domain-containing protein n=1 Tax=Arthrobacter sp. NPDC057013 TaxID=3345999 RepID=UPI0036402F34